MADRIAVLQDGEIRQVANPETILKAPATDFVADLFEVVFMTNLIATFQDRFSDWLTALSQHLQLSLLTLLLAIFIAIPWLFIFAIMRSWRIGFCRLQGFSRPSRLWPCWSSLSP